ncbi:unnamed protein product [Citrullus colocynthis]|uniref:Nuclear cap-binding protein subunit 2 n=1 Tax=Citrullus colocynthis TaxID=252529 RepID=A0ABP0XMZ3_9ROSI
MGWVILCPQSEINIKLGKSPLLLGSSGTTYMIVHAKGLCATSPVHTKTFKRDLILPSTRRKPSAAASIRHAAAASVHLRRPLPPKRKGKADFVVLGFMASLFKDPSKLSVYRDRRFHGTQDEFEVALQTSTTVYVGNMSFYTTEEQVYELFSRAGEIKKIIMGLDKNSKTPCGFCFVLYYSREDTEDAVKYISGTILDDRPIRVDFDWGFQDGRQWGRGRSGGQVRDEYRTDYDPDILFFSLYFYSLYRLWKPRV